MNSPLGGCVAVGALRGRRSGSPPSSEAMSSSSPQPAAARESGRDGPADGLCVRCDRMPRSWGDPMPPAMAGETTAPCPGGKAHLAPRQGGQTSESERRPMERTHLQGDRRPSVDEVGPFLPVRRAEPELLHLATGRSRDPGWRRSRAHGSVDLHRWSSLRSVCGGDNGLRCGVDDAGDAVAGLGGAHREDERGRGESTGDDDPPDRGRRRR